jgi:general transcription factor 3C polypeptide 6
LRLKYLIVVVVSETQPKPNAEMTSSRENKDKPDSSTKEAPPTEVKHLASVEKVLKFRSVSVDHQQGRACEHKDRGI